MRTSARRSYRLKLPAQLLVFGLWAVMFALFLLYFTLQLMGMLSTFDAGVLGAEAGMNLDGFLVGSLVALYRGGLVTLGAGGLLMAGGSFFLIGALR